MTDNNALAQELDLDARAFRENTVYTADGDPVRLVKNAERMEAAAKALRTPAPASGEVGEPVAWMYDGPDGQHYIHEHRDVASQQLIGWGWTETPLYTADMLERLAGPVQDDPEHFLTAHVSEDGSVVGIDHPTKTDWHAVRAAHVALRDRINERLATEDNCPFKPTQQPGADQLERVARALYKASCALDPVEATEPDWGRGGYKTQIIYWEGLARAALTALTPSAVAGQPKYATDEDRRAARDFFGSWPRVTVPDYLEPALAQTLAAHRLLGQQQGARGMQWQPIETAQRDGSFVILHLAHGEPDVSIGYYDGGPEWLFVEADILPTAAYPTHWMPLPAPPASLPEEG